MSLVSELKPKSSRPKWDKNPKKIHVVGGTSYVGKHVLLNLIESGEITSLSLSDTDQADRMRDVVTARNYSNAGGHEIEFSRLYLESKKSWAGCVRGNDAVIVILGPARVLDVPVGKLGTELDEFILTNAFKAMSSQGVRQGIVILHSDESLEDHLSPRQLRRPPGRKPNPELWRAMKQLENRNNQVTEIAGRLAEKYAPQVNITVLKPSRVLGAPVDNAFGISLRPFEQLLLENRRHLPDLSIHVINVRDLAELTRKLLWRKSNEAKFEAIEASTHTVYLDQVVSSVEAPDGAPSKVGRVPTLLLRIMSIFSIPLRTVVASLGQHAPADSKAARLWLGSHPVAVHETFQETARFLAMNS